MFCGRASVVKTLALARDGMCTPGGGVLQVAAYEFYTPVCGCDNLHAAILYQPPSTRPDGRQFNVSWWQAVAIRVVYLDVRFVVGAFTCRRHPLIQALGLFVTTNFIETEADSDLPICVLGDVGCFKGPRSDTVHIAVAEGQPRHLPFIPSINYRPTTQKVEETVKAMISHNGSKANRQGGKVKERTDHGFMRYTTRKHERWKEEQERWNKDRK